MTNEGLRYAYRERAHTHGDPVRPVELVKEVLPLPEGEGALARRRVRGLEEWVPKVRLVVPWDEKEALLEDERRMLTALEASGEVYGTTTYRAVETVFSPALVAALKPRRLGARRAEAALVDNLEVAATRLGLGGSLPSVGRCRTASASTGHRSGWP